jgi:thioredoxin 1
MSSRPRSEPVTPGGRVHELTIERLRVALAGPDVVVIVFYADWCAPCRSFQDTLAAVADEHRDVQFALVDVDRQTDLAKAFQVGAVPKIAMLRSGAMVFSHEGELTDEALTDLVEQVRRLDMTELRRTAAERSGRDDGL